jgi:hypothetical protein
MTTHHTKQLKILKNLDLSHFGVAFWLVKRKVLHREADYSVLRVAIDEKLKKRFKGYVKAQLQTPNFHLDAYEFTNADTDDVLLSIDAEATDFPKVEVAIAQGFDNPIAQEYEELLNSWAYVVQFERGKERLYAWRKINAITNPKKVESRKATFFQNHKLIDVEEKQVFLIDPHFDFFIFEGTTFIANKREFESSMNFREGMKNHGNELLDHFQGMHFLSDVEPIREYVGDNLHHLRKLASIKKAGYYQQPHYVASLIKVCQVEGWELKIADGRIVVELETIELLLKLLNNERLRSPINNELFDAAVKKTVAKKGKAA